jgi:hypothetical protein
LHELILVILNSNIYASAIIFVWFLSHVP